MCKWNDEALAAKLYATYLDAIYDPYGSTSRAPRKPSAKSRAANWRALGATEKAAWLAAAAASRAHFAAAR